jgi:transcriptional regulator with XRE-family HTH domain
VVDDRRAAFCARLKAARERKGVALEEIAAATKIARSLLKGLEENNLSRWPHGLYRRAYLRDYLRAIDLPEQSIVAEFVRLFPDEESPLPAAAAEPEREEPSALSLTLAESKIERLEKTRNHVTAATIDLAVVLSLTALAWWLIHADLWATGALVSLVYYSLGTAAIGSSPGMRILEDRSWRRPRESVSHADPVAPDTLLSRMREARGLPPESSEPAMTGTGSLFSVLVVSVVRTLFLR